MADREQFCAITGSDPGVAAQYLELSGGDVEAAISLFFGTNGELAQKPPPHSNFRDQMDVSPSYDFEDHIPRPTQDRKLPTRHATHPPLDFEQFQPYTQHYQNPHANKQWKRPDMLSFLEGCEIDTDFVTQTFECKFGETHPDWVGGSFSEFYQQHCVIGKKVIFVSLHPTEQHTEDTFFKSLVLSNRLVKNYFASSGIPYWIGEVSPEQEAYYYQSFNKKLRYPYQALIVQKGSTFTILDTKEDTLPPVQFIEWLKSQLSSHALYLERLRLEEVRKETERLEVAEQNRKFKESETRDVEIQRKKDEDAEMSEITQISKKYAVAGARKHALSKLDELPPEPPRNSTPRPYKIGIRLPDGSKIDRFFPPDAKFQVVLDWVAAKIAEKLTDDTFLDDTSPSLDAPGAVIPWTITAYRLVLSFPRKSFSSADSQSSLESLDLGPQAMLFLERGD